MSSSQMPPSRAAASNKIFRVAKAYSAKLGGFFLTASCTPSRGGVQPFRFGGGDGGRSRWREAQDGTLELGG